MLNIIQPAHYNGSVTITTLLGNTQINKITQHNAGYQNLFIFLYNCLAGQFTQAANSVPQYIKAFDDKDQEVTLGYVSIAGSPTITNDGIIFNFRIPQNALKISTGISINKFTLYGKNKNTLADMTLTQALSVGTDQTLLVDWQLTISNKE